MRAVAYRFAYSQRNGDEICQEREPEPERDGDWKLLLDELENRGIAKIALPKIEPGIVPQHQQETLIRRLVEPELFLQAFDEIGIETLGATVLRRYGAAPPPPSVFAAAPTPP